MCLSPLRNTNYRSIAYKKGLTEFSCGHCPECLNARSNEWALRCVYQVKESKKAVMVTLTYDTFQRDKDGKIMTDKNGVPLENRASRNVDKRDCQLFIKRLREYFHRVKKVDNIKYLLSAEYGKPKPNVPKGRPHYHAILFGVEFDDLIYHKKSKRGNTIHRSRTLEKLWKNGICTVDATHITPAVAKYCTKYALKDIGVDDTFMLCSQGIGLNEMLKDFNGKSYWVEGREHPIPRIVWQRYIAKKYDFDSRNEQYRKLVENDSGIHIDNFPPILTYKYKAFPKQTKTNQYRFNFDCEEFTFIEDGYYIRTRYKTNNNLLPNRYTYHLFPQEVSKENYEKEIQIYEAYKKARDAYRIIRDNDETYQTYLRYWKDKAKAIENIRGKAINRVYLLDDRKYHNYKIQYLKWTCDNYLSGYRKNPPRKVKRYIKIVPNLVQRYLEKVTCPYPLVLKGQVTGKKRKKGKYIVFGNEVYTDDFSKTPIITKKCEQLSIYPRSNA